jgi:hypothetical protein
MKNNSIRWLIIIFPVKNDHILVLNVLILGHTQPCHHIIGG